MAHHKHHKHGGYKKGGKTHTNVYNAVGSPEEKEGETTTPGFKKGGAKREKHAGGGKVHGKHMHHLGRKKRAAGGKSPYTSGHHTSGPADSHAGRGHEGTQPGKEDH